MWRTQKLNIFGSDVFDYTADQLNLIKITKEYSQAQRVVQFRKDEMPKTKILEDYTAFCMWRKTYYSDPKRKNKQPAHGW